MNEPHPIAATIVLWLAGIIGWLWLAGVDWQAVKLPRTTRLPRVSKFWRAVNVKWIDTGWAGLVMFLVLAACLAWGFWNHNGAWE